MKNSDKKQKIYADKEEAANDEIESKGNGHKEKNNKVYFIKI